MILYVYISWNDQHNVWLTSIVFLKILFWNTDFQKNSKTSPNLESSCISFTQRPLMLTTNIQWQNQDVNTINDGSYSNFTISPLPQFLKYFSPFQM